MCLHRACVKSWSGQVQLKKSGSTLTWYSPCPACDGTIQTFPLRLICDLAAICKALTSRSVSCWVDIVGLLPFVGRLAHNEFAEVTREQSRLIFKRALVVSAARAFIL